MTTGHNDIDRCERCGGKGERTEATHNWPAFDTPYYHTIRCPACHGRGRLHSVESLARAVERGTTLAWCATHARDGDPLPGMWDDAPMRARSRIWSVCGNKFRADCLAACTPESMKALGHIPPEEIEWARRIPPPTLAEVIDAAQRRRTA